MEPPVTPKPIPSSAAKLPLDHTNKLFGIVYITLTGVIDTIVPTASPWLWVGKSMSYLIKLASILWWALPTQSATCQFPNTSNPYNQGWFPDTERTQAAGSLGLYAVFPEDQGLIPGFDLFSIPNVFNAHIHALLILPLMGSFEEKSLAFTFATQNESGFCFRKYDCLAS
ncbi:hypothetical protein DSO57_1014903 [Entomophthora muscae]|uniref:Uncharacterized protein n=1 Tax=Entomophthora muscae TaxID=34485 RepID=A0ACC2SIF3_9FUNG|nr:hypothetical protein DSO57_1014903 [Entomophthora muscae]